MNGGHAIYSACSNPTYVILVTVSAKKSYLNQSLTQKNISGIRTRALEITLIFKIHLGWIKDILDAFLKIKIISSNCMEVDVAIKTYIFLKNCKNGN
jgi:uncharacterized protein